jgi:DNA invertase Pin-like site-specific DNA recombinase
MQAQPKAVIFARVSSKAQEDEGYSLESQLKLLKSYCAKKSFKIVKEFRVAETASKEQRRKVFHELLAYISKNKISHFVVEKTDRAVRNIKDAAYLYDWIEGDERRVLHSVKENLELHKWSTSQVKLMWSIFIAFAKQYTDSLREEAMKGWDEKLAQGWLPASPPPGYMTVTEDRKKIHVPNPDTQCLMEIVFQFARLPDSSYTLVQQKMTELGLTTSKGKPFSKSQVHRILTNPFYIGINRFNGKDYPGAQEPLISKKLFYAVQRKLRNGRSPKMRKHNPVFKAMLRCAHCGYVVTWQKQKGRYYGACQRLVEGCKGKTLLREDRLEAQIVARLETTKDPGGKILKKLETALQVARPLIIGGHREKVISALDKQIVRLHRMKDALYDDRLTGYISKERYEAKCEEIDGQIAEIQKRLGKLHEAQMDEKQREPEPKSHSAIVRLYLKSSPSDKRIILSNLFSKMIADGDHVQLQLLS